MDNIRYYVYIPLRCCVHCVVIRWWLVWLGGMVRKEVGYRWHVIKRHGWAGTVGCFLYVTDPVWWRYYGGIIECTNFRVYSCVCLFLLYWRDSLLFLLGRSHVCSIRFGWRMRIVNYCFWYIVCVPCIWAPIMVSFSNVCVMKYVANHLVYTTVCISVFVVNACI